MQLGKGILRLGYFILNDYKVYVVLVRYVQTVLPITNKYKG